MSNDTQITIVGHMTASPDLRFIPSGAAVASFTVASTPRKFDKKTEQWVDGQTLFLRCTAWRQMAENCAESLDRGMAVIVQGRLTQREYEKDGQTRTVVELEVDEIGPSLRSATARVTKAQRSGPPSGQDQVVDPWAAQPAGRGTVHTPPAGGWPNQPEPRF